VTAVIQDKALAQRSEEVKKLNKTKKTTKSSEVLITPTVAKRVACERSSRSRIATETRWSPLEITKSLIQWIKCPVAERVHGERALFKPSIAFFG
jgi:hypothetical protein